MRFRDHFSTSLVGLTLIISMVWFTPLYAQDSTPPALSGPGSTAGPGGEGGNQGGSNIEALLRAIKDNTYGILTQVNNLPYYMKNLDDFITSWLSPDTSQTSATLQGSFTEYGNSYLTGNATIRTLQQQLLLDLFGNATSATLKNANDLSYQTLLGLPYYKTDPRDDGSKPPKVNPPYEYLKNAAGLNIPHRMPQMSWSGSTDDIKLYYGYYNTVMSASSFNAYALSDLYVDYLTGGRLNKMQESLYQQATSSEWFTQVAGKENLGGLVRQLLLFQSQTFVLLTQLLETEKKLLTATVINNSLLVMLNASNEATLVRNASAPRPT